MSTAENHPDYQEEKWTLGRVLIAIGAMGAMSFGFWCLYRYTIKSQQFNQDALHAAALVVTNLTHPDHVQPLPSVLSAFGPVLIKQGADPRAIIGPLDSDHCTALMADFAQPAWSSAFEISLFDATAQTWTFRYQAAMNYYAAQGPHGSYEPSPCEIVNDSQRVLTVRPLKSAP